MRCQRVRVPALEREELRVVKTIRATVSHVPLLGCGCPDATWTREQRTQLRGVVREAVKP
jgi:hypothetical protein